MKKSLESKVLLKDKVMKDMTAKIINLQAQIDMFKDMNGIQEKFVPKSELDE